MQRSTRIPTAIPNAGVLSSQHLLSYGFVKPDASITGKKKTAIDGDKTSDSVTDDINKNGMLNGVKEKAPTAEEQKSPTYSSNLTTSQLNVLSYNLSELADRISPTKTDHIIEFPEEGIGEGDLNPMDFEELASKLPKTGDRSRSESTSKARDSNSLHSKLPYSRRSSKKSKSYVPKRKSFRKQAGAEREESLYGSNSQESEGHFSLKHDSEDSGYGSSRSTFSQRGNSGNELATDPENDNSEALTRKISDVEKRLKSLLTGKSLATGGQNPSDNFADSENFSQKSNTVEAPLSKSALDSPSSIANSLQRDPPLGADDTSVEEDSKKFDSGLGKSPFLPPSGKAAVASQDDSALPRGRPRPTLVRRRTTLMSFRRPRLAAAQEGDGDVVELDEATYTQCVGDIKSMKTMLLKLKRELQEADVVSPLSRSFTMSASPNAVSSPKSLRRSDTCDSASMHDKLMRIRSASTSSAAARKNVKGNTSPAPETSKEDEALSLREELRAMKEKVEEMTQERRSLLIEREEHEHEIESKNLTIRLLQKQLEAQDNQDEMAYLKRQVKLLSEQVHSQQNKISELRSRLGPTASANPVTTPGKKDPAKADIRNRLRDAFVRHLDQSAKNHAQLSRHIQRAENSISEAQKGSSRKSSTADSLKSDSGAEESTRSKGAKRRDEPLRRSSVPILGTRSSDHEIEAGAHTDSERHSSRKHSSCDSAYSEKSDRRRSRLSRSGPTAWAPGTIEKIVKSWKETREASSKPAEAQVVPDSKLGPPRGQPHVDFL